MSNHINQSGLPRMVDVGGKQPSQRRAVARGYVIIPKTIQGLDGGEWWSPKGPVFQTAVIAGIQGAKQTSTTIPLCHPLGLTSCDVAIDPVDWQTFVQEAGALESPPNKTESAREATILRVTCTAATTAPTGVEMETLCGVSTACLTIYDMGKSVSHGIVITAVRLLEKTGGKLDWRLGD